VAPIATPHQLQRPLQKVGRTNCNAHSCWASRSSTPNLLRRCRDEPDRRPAMPGSIGAIHLMQEIWLVWVKYVIREAAKSASAGNRLRGCGITKLGSVARVGSI
jgi:hypothetical protein